MKLKQLIITVGVLAFSSLTYSQTPHKVSTAADTAFADLVVAPTPRTAAFDVFDALFTKATDDGKWTEVFNGRVTLEASRFFRKKCDLSVRKNADNTLDMKVTMNGHTCAMKALGDLKANDLNFGVRSKKPGMNGADYSLLFNVRNKDPIFFSFKNGKPTTILSMDEQCNCSF